MRNIYYILLSVFILTSCHVENDETVAIPDIQGAASIEGFQANPEKTLNGKMTSLTSGEEVSSNSLVSRSCGGRTGDLTFGEVRPINSRTSNCDPLSLMTPNFGYMMWNAWDIPTGTTAYFADYLGNGVPGSVFVQDFLTSHFQGLKNAGPPPPVAPGTTIEWVDDAFYNIIYEEVPNSNGGFDNLGDSQGLNISTESLEFLRDELACEVLDIYFDQYYGATASDGYGYLIGDVVAEALDPLCGDSRLIYVTVNIGHNVYTAPEFPTVDFD